MLAFSTCWNNARHTCGRQVIKEIRGLGFTRVELSHGMTVAKLPGFHEAFLAGEMEVVGLHNYFPAPVEVMIDAPDAYEFTSHRQRERERAMALTKRTLETAAKFEAGYVVLHLGSVPMNPNRWTKRLGQLVSEGEPMLKKAEKLRRKFIKKRAKKGGLYHHRAFKAVEELAELAADLGVKLALESRSRYEDVPTEDEMVQLQEHFADNPWVGYWHDFGHVQLKHNLGLLNHGEWLAKMGKYCIGAHVHDVYELDIDHRVPLTGQIDFKSLFALMPEDIPLVWELSPSREAEEIKEALKVFQIAYPERC